MGATTVSKDVVGEMGEKEKWNGLYTMKRGVAGDTVLVGNSLRCHLRSW